MSNYVVVKLVSGEQLMADLSSESEFTLNLLNPMLIKTRELEDGESITAIPYCQFSSDKMFNILKTHIMYTKQMHEVFIPHYVRIVKEHEEHIELRTNKKEQEQQTLEWEDTESLTTEEIQKRIDVLESLFGNQEESPVEEKEETRVVSKGNKTFH